MPEIISRKAAVALGLKRFFTGEPCRKGHLAERRCSNGRCVACLLARNVEWKRRNAQHERQQRREHYGKFRSRLLQQSKNWRDNNLEHEKKRERTWYAKNIEKVRERYRKSYAENAEQRRKYSKSRSKKIHDLLAVLRVEMPEILKEFGL